LEGKDTTIHKIDKEKSIGLEMSTFAP
jgi:hypothetical protein